MSTNLPIHSRGTGRSGPKRKSGCITCRRRKVRCDEQKPNCNHCIRLRLDCIYGERPKAQLLSSPSSSDTPPKLERVSMDNTVMAMLPPAELATDPLWEFGNDPSLAYAEPFQDLFSSTLDNSFDIGIGGNAFLGPEMMTETFENASIPPAIPVYAELPASGNDASSYNEERRRYLVHHFLNSANPVSVILPTHTEWKSASRALLGMVTESGFLLHGICALSALHLYATNANDSYDEAFALYKLSSRQVNDVLDGPDVTDRQLKPAFATIFLLTHVELLAQTTSPSKSTSWPLTHLQRAHHRVRQHSERIRTWTGTSKRLLTWLTLLQTKAEYNSGHNSLEHSSATLSKSTGDPFTKDQNASTVEAEDENDTRTMYELAYETLNQPGFDFFVMSQAFISRIISLDWYHRHRGSAEAEFETFKDAQRIAADLDKLWATRPTTMAFLNSPNDIVQALQPGLAAQILLNLRVYAANFWALYIYLHRVAYKTHPADKAVLIPVARILEYTRDIITASTLHRNQHNIYASNPADPLPGLPVTMLWPMFLAALESSPEEQEWVLQTMRQMDLRQTPYAKRTVVLLEEVLMRQKREGRRVDHRSVRREMFDRGELGVLY